MLGHAARVIYGGRTIHSAQALFDDVFGERVKAALPFRFTFVILRLEQAPTTCNQ